MNESALTQELNKLADTARELGYTVVTPELFIDPVHGSKLAYYQHGTNKIVMHDHFAENAPANEERG